MAKKKLTWKEEIRCKIVSIFDDPSLAGQPVPIALDLIKGRLVEFFIKEVKREARNKVSRR